MVCPLCVSTSDQRKFDPSPLFRNPYYATAEEPTCQGWHNEKGPSMFCSGYIEDCIPRKSGKIRSFIHREILLCYAISIHSRGGIGGRSEQIAPNTQLADVSGATRVNFSNAQTNFNLKSPPILKNTEKTLLGVVIVLLSYSIFKQR